MTLVLLPGLDGTEVLLEPLIRELPAWIRSVVLGYPNTGPNSYEELLEHIDAQIGSLTEFAVLGLSFGGPLALMLANRRPTQVRALVLCATFVSPPFSRLARFRGLIRTPVIACVRTLRRLRFWVPGLAPEEIRRAKSRMWWRVNSRVLAARSRAAMGVDARRLLASCPAPTMYLAASDDKVVKRHCLDEMRSIVQDMEVCEIQGSHLMLFSHPALAAEKISSYLRSFNGS